MTSTKTILDSKKHTLTYVEPKKTKISKTNPLHLDIPYRIRSEPDRCLGRSTALSLNYISTAIQNPYTWIKIQDHHNTKEADAHLFAMIKNHIYKLGLIQFYFKSKYNSEFFISFGDPK